MPTPPKLGDATAEVWQVEVAHQSNSEQLGSTDGDVGIARKVSVDLEGEEDGGQQQRASRMVRIVREHLVGIHRTVVGHHHLLEEAPKDLAHPIDGGVKVELPLLEELRQEVRRPFDGSRHQLGEKRDEGKEGDDIPGRFNFPTININGIAQGLEGVERDAYR